jgi:methenyltetrahydromethanopterin cyclohydrolase
MAGLGKSIGVETSESPCGALLIDAGIESHGSPEAGRLFSEACLGGTASVRIDMMNLGNISIPSVFVTVNEPVRGCMAAQYAGWTIKSENDSSYFAMGSGPARALYGAEDIFRDIGCTERADVAVIALETRKFPPDGALGYIAESCGVKTENLAVLMAPTASITGCVQVAARIVETGLHKLHELGFSIKNVTAGYGSAPIAPVASSDGAAIGWTNDGILYGGTAWYTVNCEDDDIKRILPELPAEASRDYGTPFYDLLRRYDWDFYKIDPLLFSPAVVYISSAKSGNTYRAGAINAALLEKEWFGSV